jgi:hypothetical protein
LVLWAAPAAAQRTQFATPLPQESQPLPLYTQPPPVYAQPPAATLDGTIQPIDPNWDPYNADPGTQTPLLVPPQGNIYTQPDGSFAQRERLVQQIHVEATHLGGDGGQDLDVNDVEANVTVAFPFSYGVAPLLVTPGFAFHFWEGPDVGAFPGSPDLPPRTYDAYLEFGWRPQLTPRLSLDLAVRPGIYTDFEFFDSDAFRIKGRALGILNASPQFQYVAGIVYLDRLKTKLLPAGGVIWTPTDATRWEILFPRPKLSQRLTTVGNTEFWWYAAGEYGGDSWAIERDSGLHDQFDYNDLRVSLGIEWTSFPGYRGYFEAGYVFEREVIYKNGPGSFDPDNTYMLRGGLTY